MFARTVMTSGPKFTKILRYQSLGFLAVIALGFLDEIVRLPALIFADASPTWELRRSTVTMLLILGVWFLVSVSTRRIVERLQYLEKFLRVCSWCHHIHHRGEWITMEQFLHRGFDTPTTHGICPRCLAQQKAAFERSRQRRNTASAPGTATTTPS